MSTPRRMGPRGLAIIKEREGLRLEAYLDTKQGKVWTIGYGRTRGVTAGMKCTEAQAEAWLAEDVVVAESDVAACVTRPLNQGEFDALCSFAFNVGREQFRDSTLLTLVNTYHRLEAAMQFQRWSIDEGKRERGLLRRRFIEAALFLEDT